MRNQFSQNGFTLIEMMVALVLLSMISLIGYQGVVFTIGQWNSGEQKLASSLYKYQSLSMMRKLLSRIERNSYQHDGEYIYAFSGKHTTLRFVSKFENTKQGGLYICELYGNEIRNNVEISYGLLHPENGYFDKPINMKSTEVLAGIEKIRFWYFGSQHGESGRWYKQWDAETRLPKLVKYEFVDLNGARTRSVIYVETSDI